MQAKVPEQCLPDLQPSSFTHLKYMYFPVPRARHCAGPWGPGAVGRRALGIKARTQSSELLVLPPGGSDCLNHPASLGLSFLSNNKDGVNNLKIAFQL